MIWDVYHLSTGAGFRNHPPCHLIWQPKNPGFEHTKKSDVNIQMVNFVFTPSRYIILTEKNTHIEIIEIHYIMSS